jgi:hypothetical protein
VLFKFTSTLLWLIAESWYYSYSLTWSVATPCIINRGAYYLKNFLLSCSPESHTVLPILFNKESHYSPSCLCAESLFRQTGVHLKILKDSACH